MLQVLGQNWGWQGCGAGGAMGSTGHAELQQKQCRGDGLRLVLGSIKAEAASITDSGSEQAVAAEGGRQQLPWEGSDNIHQQIIYTNHGAKQKHLCGAQLWL